MNKFITTYKWVCLPFVFSSAAVLATPDMSQQYKDAQQTSRVSQQFIGGNTQIGAGVTDQGNVDLNAQHVISRGAGHNTNVGIWADFDVKGDDKGIEGRGAEINHNWVTTDNNNRVRRVNKAKVAYDRNAAGHDKVTVGYGQEIDTLFWEGRVSKGLSGNENTRTNSDGTISDRAYEYGLGGSIGTFLPDSNLRVRAGLDHEWSSEVGLNEKDAQNTTLSAGAQKMFEGTGHSVSLDVSGSKRSGGYQNGASSDEDISARLGYKYDFAGASSFQNASTTRRVRVEVPNTAVAAQPRSPQTKRVATYKTVPVYSKKIVKTPYKRMVKSTMGLEGQTFFKLNSSKLIPSAQKRLTEVANQIKKTGYKGTIRITGNTCGLGNADYDQRLSERRAKSVRNFLIKKGFNPNHLMARGLGKSNPKYANIPGEGFKNRRVDIEYVAEVNKAQTAYKNVDKKVQTGTRKVATGFKNVPTGTNDVMIYNGKAGTPRVIWRTETIKNPPAWIQRALNNNINHNTSVNTFQTNYGNDVDRIVNDFASAKCEGLPVTIDVLANDFSATNQQFTISGFSQGQNGTVTASNDGKLIYTPTAAGCGDNDQFTYTVMNEDGEESTATVTVTVAPGIVAENETVSAAAGEQIIIDVLGNDDPNTTIDMIVTQPLNGTVEIENGRIIYTPSEGYTGSDTFTYQIIDDNGNTDTATVTVNVEAPQNNLPVAMSDQATTESGEPITIDLLANDTDADEIDTLTIVTVSDPTNGTAEIVNNEVVYTPNPGFEGNDSFTYTVSDGNGGSATATTNIIVTAPGNTAPEAVDDTSSVVCSGPVTINVLNNDTDADNNNLTIQEFTQGSNGTVTQDAEGNLIYTTNGDSCNTEDTFTYTITDGISPSNVATVTIAIGPTENRNPDALDDEVTTQVDTPVEIMAAANDTDEDGDTLTITEVSDPQNGTATITSGGRSIMYTPDAGYIGVDVFDYTISDGRGGTSMATETVNVTAAPNTAPVAQDDTATTQESTSVTLATVANDTDPDGDNLIVTDVAQPNNGTATISSDGQSIIYTPNDGYIGVDVFDYTISDGRSGTSMATETITVTAAPNVQPSAVDDNATTQESIAVTLATVSNDTDPDGDDLLITNVDQPQNGTATASSDGKSILYTPNAGFTGVDVFDYTISDGRGGTSMATETVTVTAAPNVQPTAVDDSATTQESAPVTLATVSNDSDPDGDNLTISNVAQPQNGTATVSADGKSITYTPNAGFTGVDVFDYTISDGRGGTSMATETVTVTAAPNVQPTAVDDSATTQESTPVTLATVSNDSDPDGDNLTISNVAQPQNGRATVSADGKSITYTPNAGFTGIEVFDYTITDGRGGTSMATETVTVTAAPNVQPTAVDDSATTQEYTSVTLATVSNDSDPDGDNLTISNVQQPQNGTVTVSSDGKSITYTPNAGFTGIEVFDYTISDGRGGTSMATETVTVTAAPNTAPIAQDDSATTQSGTPVTLMTVANDSDADGDDITITNVTQPQNGSATISNDGKQIIYTPNSGFSGVDIFDYTITDGRGGSAMATETVVVESLPNNPPLVVDDMKTTGCAVITIDALANDSDPENDTLTIVSVGGASLGVATVVGNQIRYQPNNTCDKGGTGLDSFIYTVSDGTNSSTGSVDVDVTGAVNDTYTQTDNVSTTEDTPITINVLANDSGIGLRIISKGSPSHGTVELSGNLIIYTPNPGFVGQDVFYYDIEDQNGYTDYGTVNVTVHGNP